MRLRLPDPSRRQALLGAAAAILGWRGAPALAAIGAPVFSVADFGARPGSGSDDTKAIQAAIAAAEKAGGGIVRLAGRHRCSQLTISGRNIRLEGQGGWLVDCRLTIRQGAAGIELADVGIVDTRGDKRAFLLDVAGTDCRVDGLQLVKDPPVGGVQMYVRQSASGCRFSSFRLKGSNGIILAGSDLLFEDFDMEARMPGGDDAFAIKALGAATKGITIRNGRMRGYAAIVSFGSEIGSKAAGNGSVSDVLVENVTAEDCSSVAFFKPGALKYDWRNGVVERVRLRNLTLRDPAGTRFRTGIRMMAGRGATIRDVEATGIDIVARAKDRGVAPTAAIYIMLPDVGAPATIKDVDLQLRFVDPYSGAVHSASTPGYPIDHVVRIEKLKSRRGSISGITLDVEGRGAAMGGILVGEGLDDAIRVDRAVLASVGTDPPGRRGAGIWSNSRISLGEVTIESGKLPKLGGRAFDKR